MYILKNKAFTRFARKEGISDAVLRQVVKDANNGKIDVDYGGGVIKQRLARPG
ncbi:MAG: type II toxin-antitoxin system RelE/ParE family toxin, partial [Holosporales bacterium]